MNTGPGSRWDDGLLLRRAYQRADERGPPIHSPSNYPDDARPERAFLGSKRRVRKSLRCGYSDHGRRTAAGSLSAIEIEAAES